MQVKLQGFADLDKALQQIEKQSTRKAVLRRSLRKAAEPMAQLASSLAPIGATGNLAESVVVGVKLDGRQAKIHRKMFRNDKQAVEIFVGPSYLKGGGGRHGHLQEFGTVNHGPQPFMRPAWDQDKGALLDRLGEEIAADIEKTAARAARKAAKAA